MVAWILRYENAFLKAAKNRDKVTIRRLLERGVDVDCKDDFDRTALYWVVDSQFTTRHDLTVIVPLLLENGANTEIKRKGFTGKVGDTPLHRAVVRRHTAIVRLLLENGANADSIGQNEETPIFTAAYNGEMNIVKLLLENGANPNYENSRGETPLIIAMLGEGSEAIVRLLLENGANIESEDKYHNTPLSLAAGKCYGAIVTLLLEKGANIETADKTALLHFTTNRGFEAIAKRMLNNGADVDSKDRYGDTALILAAFGGHKAIVRLLL